MTWIESVVRRLQRSAQHMAPTPQVERLLPTMRGSWRADVPGSLVVFLVALPLCLGIALASNAPLFSGLIAGVVGGLVVGALSGSQLMVSGPAAGLTAIVVTALVTLGFRGLPRGGRMRCVVLGSHARQVDLFRR
jgi:MFS superfamily sulfate permease-like transporter